MKLLPLLLLPLLAACNDDPVRYCRFIEGDQVRIEVRLNDEESFLASARVKRLRTEWTIWERNGCYYGLQLENPHFQPDYVVVHESRVQAHPGNFK